MIHGAQIRKAVDALFARGHDEPHGRREAARARARRAWLLASGPRTRAEIELAAKGSALAVALGDESAVRAHVERLASRDEGATPAADSYPPGVARGSGRSRPC